MEPLMAKYLEMPMGRHWVLRSTMEMSLEGHLGKDSQLGKHWGANLEQNLVIMMGEVMAQHWAKMMAWLTQMVRQKVQ